MESILRDNYKPEESLSLVDLLEADRDNQIQAQRLSDLCGDDINVCTYSKGYVNQSVFACLDCTAHELNSTVDKLDSTKLAGFCLGCSMNCHLDHHVVELWTKRKFKCDCGNSKWRGTNHSECVLSCKKDAVNVLNRYNHNFIGKYCYCHREYCAAEEAMHQCLLCQDWFHETCIIVHHLKANPELKRKYDQQHRSEMTIMTNIQTANDRGNESNDANPKMESTGNSEISKISQISKNDEESFFEHFRKCLIPSHDEENTQSVDAFVCKHCALKNQELLLPYRWKKDSAIHHESNAFNESNDSKVEENTTTNTKEESQQTVTSLAGNKRTFSSMAEDTECGADGSGMRKKRKYNKLDENYDSERIEQIRNKLQEQKSKDNSNCHRVLMDLEKAQEWTSVIGGGLWMESGWVDRLCQCTECMTNVYGQYKLEWLFEADEVRDGNSVDVNAQSLDVDPSQSLSSEFSTDAMVASSISKLPRQQALDALQVVVKGTDVIKQRLREFLRKSPPKKVITPDDIHEMFRATVTPMKPL